jgi:hypothetical protein
MVRGYSNMCCTFSDQRQHGVENTTNCSYFLPAFIHSRGKRMIVPEEFVCAIGSTFRVVAIARAGQALSKMS